MPKEPWTVPLFFLAPGFFKELVPSRTPAIVLVSNGIVEVVVLVVILGFVKFHGRTNFGDNRLCKLSRFLQSVSGLQSQSSLFLVMVEDRRSVLAPYIRELSVFLCRIHVFPKHIEQLHVGDFGRILEDLNRLEMSSPARRDLLVGGILLHTPRVSGCGG